MNSLEIQYFLTIVKYGSFTEAAQTLSVSQPAISKQIRQLEAELGCSLFARSGRTLSLTEAGQAYYAYFQQCRFQLDLLKNKLEEQKKDGKPTIRIAYPEDVDPAYFRDKIQSAAAALETPVRLEFSCYPEGELTDLLTARIQQPGAFPAIPAHKLPLSSRCPCSHLPKCHRSCSMPLPAPKLPAFPTSETTPFSFPKPMPHCIAAGTFTDISRASVLHQKFVLQPIYPQFWTWLHRMKGYISPMPGAADVRTRITGC